MKVHERARDRTQAKGIRLLRSTWLELAAIQARRAHPTLAATLAEAVAEYIENDRERRKLAA